MKLKTPLTSIARLSKWRDTPPKMVGDPSPQMGKRGWLNWQERCKAVYEYEIERKRRLAYIKDHGDDDYKAVMKVERALNRARAK